MLAEAFLCPLLKDCLPTVEHEDDKPGVIRALYNNICSLKKWASTAYNEHVLAPLAKIAMLTKKQFFRMHGLLDDIAEPDDVTEHTPA